VTVCTLTMARANRWMIIYTQKMVWRGSLSVLHVMLTLIYFTFNVQTMAKVLHDTC